MGLEVEVVILGLLELEVELVGKAEGAVEEAVGWVFVDLRSSEVDRYFERVAAEVVGIRIQVGYLRNQILPRTVGCSEVSVAVEVGSNLPG